MAGITIPIATDTRQAVKGTDALADGFDKIADAVEDAARDSGTAGDKIERSLRDAQRETRDTAREFEKAGRKARDFGDDAERGMKGAGHSTGEFKEEALANFSEVASSFQGDMTSIVDLAQGTFGGLAAVGGPIGLALGAVGALIGATFSGLSTAANENAQAAEERISDMYQKMLESGQNYLTNEQIGQRIADIADDTEKFKQAQEDAAAAGVNVSTVLRAQAGDAGALAELQDTLAGKYAAAREAADKYLTAKGPQAGAANAEALALGGLVERYSGYNSEAQQAVDKSTAVRGAFADLGLQADGTAQQVDGVTKSVNSVPGSKTVRINVDDAVAQERLRQLGKSINVDMFVTPRTGRGVNG